MEILGNLPHNTSYVLEPGVGRVTLEINKIEEEAYFTFDENGVVNLIRNSDNVVKTDTDGKICILDVGDHVEIKNRMGSDKGFKMEIK